MAKSNRVFAVHPGDILKTEFMEPMGMSAYELAKALNFPGIMMWCEETGLSAPIQPFVSENISVCPRSSG